MLSDEEKRIIKSVKEEYKKGIEQGNVLFPIFLNQAKILLNLIEKQQKEIEELKEKNRHITKETVEFVNSHYISKDKIKEMIKELEKLNDEATGTGFGFAIYYLCSLLEKE